MTPAQEYTTVLRKAVQVFSLPLLKGIFLFSTYRLTGFCLRLPAHSRMLTSVCEGGMATVYLAKDLKHNHNVALKVLKPELAGQDSHGGRTVDHE